MRTFIVALSVGTALADSAARAHGPQIQITNENGSIVTREIHLEEPYTTLTPEKQVYVMPLLPFDGVWYSRPNNTPSATIPGAPQYASGPGLAWGYDQVDGGPRTFEADSVLSVGFADGLQRWNGLAFGHAGVTELKAFRGSNVDVSSPLENFAITSDAGPFDSVSFAPIAADYGPGAHSSLRFALLGDGLSPTSTSPDGVYLLTLQASSTQAGLSPSDPYHFVLAKNAAAEDVFAAVQSLGVAPSLVQWVVPEPGTLLLALVGSLALAGRRTTLQGRIERMEG